MDNAKKNNRKQIRALVRVQIEENKEKNKKLPKHKKLSTNPTLLRKRLLHPDWYK